MGITLRQFVLGLNLDFKFQDTTNKEDYYNHDRHIYVHCESDASKSFSIWKCKDTGFILIQHSAYVSQPEQYRVFDGNLMAQFEKITKYLKEIGVVNEYIR